jgi:GPI-anchor transamidase subunit U
MYRAIFILYSYVFIMPITWRYRSEPLKALILSFLVQAIVKTYPTLNDLAAPLSLLPIYSTSFDLFHSHPWSLCLFLGASLLFPILWFFWYDTLSGNLSYYYASTILHNLAAILLLLDLFRAFVHDFRSTKIHSSTRSLSTSTGCS